MSLPIGKMIATPKVPLRPPGDSTAYPASTEFVNAATGYAIRPEQFGAVGDGVTDDTASFQSALDSLSEGGLVMATGHYAIATNLTIPAGVILDFGTSPGEILPDGTWGVPGSPLFRFDFTKVFGGIYLAATATINVANRATIRNGFIVTPATAVPSTSNGAAQAIINAYAGTGVTITGSDANVLNMFIMGFAKAILVNGFERPFFDRVKADCTNGIELTVITDVGRIRDCHIFPFYGVGHNSDLSSIALVRRTGTAYYLHDQADGCRIENCFAFGYDIGVHLDDVFAVCVSVVIDNSLTNSATSGSVGVKTSGVLVNCVLDAHADSCAINYDFNHSGANSSIQAFSLRSGSAVTNFARFRSGSSGSIGEFNVGGAVSTGFLFDSGCLQWTIGRIFVTDCSASTASFSVADDAALMNLRIGDVSIFNSGAFTFSDSLFSRFKTTILGADYANRIKVTGYPSGGQPIIRADSATDTDVSLKIIALGSVLNSAIYLCRSNNGDELLVRVDGAAGTIANKLGLRAQTTGGAPEIYADGTDSTVHLKLTPTGTGGSVMIPSMVNAVDDIAAASAGVPIGGLYRNGNAVQMRVS